MSYMHIPNLYKDQRILAFREVYALEKIHGTSAHISWDGEQLSFYSGGVDHRRFVELFDVVDLRQRFIDNIEPPCTIYGEAYGGKCQGMSETYGKELRFVVFEAKIGDSWLAVPQAENVAGKLGLEFVAYEMIATDHEAVNAARDCHSIQAVRNGIGTPKLREGIVLRPPFEVTLNNGERLIAKHKNDAFAETRTPRRLDADPLVLEEASRIAAEWVTPMRLDHVLQKLPEATQIEHTGMVIKAMVEDVLREGEGEIIVNKSVRKAISAATAKMWKCRTTTLIGDRR